MQWSVGLGKFAGIELKVHLTFVLILAWVGFQEYRANGPQAVVPGVLFVLALFACVVLHEFGHALTARRYGIKTLDITLLPIGGVARLERMPEEPRQELAVALAGPMVNVVIASALGLVLAVSGHWTPLDQLTPTGGSFPQRLVIVNMFLAVFNLIPAFPMDGGRVLRALLAVRMGFDKATQVAASVGQGIALLFGAVGLFMNPFLVFIALFVWIGAAQEAMMVATRSVLGGVPVSKAMLTEFHTLAPDDPLDRAIELILAGSQHDFPVVDGSRVVGVLTRADLFGALAAKDKSRVADAMRPQTEVVDAAASLEQSLATLDPRAKPLIPVTEAGRLVGILTAENIGEFVMIRSALRSRA
jgi:Zn-dependent protease/CBS domain-containing protein